MISPTQLAKLVEAYQARQAEQANVTRLNVADSASTDVSKAA